jgi:regulator of sirC expression with transglutaminase-like and TPR domain
LLFFWRLKLRRALCRISKPDRRVYESRGIVYQDLNDHQRAVEDFTMAIRLGPDFPVDYFHRGESYLRLGKHELALQDFDYALTNGDPGTCCVDNGCCSSEDSVTVVFNSRHMGSPLAHVPLFSLSY